MVNESRRDKPEWSGWTGRYGLIKYGKAVDPANINVKNGYLYIDSWRLKEDVPGLFFTAYGEAVDLRRDEVTYRNTLLMKVPGN